ncbi:G-protein coupled receptor 151 [Pseudophryne corroboree]|uniref:G-protein coupled receptor 151 n=1 Tax=Pseudophryne corroboree TaxID=495146 RepID=UPI0030814702
MAHANASSSTMNSSLPGLTLGAGGLRPLDFGEWTFLVPSSLLLICLSGLGGNLCVIAALLHTARVTPPALTHSLILNLSVSDLLLLLFSVPLRAAAYSGSAVPLGWFVCRTADWFAHCCMSAKSITLAMAARACSTPAGDPAQQAPPRPLGMCAATVGTWLLAAILPLPEWYFTRTKHMGGSLVCLMQVPARAQELIVVYVTVYPVLVYCAPFSAAALYFWRAHAQCQRRGSKTQNLRQQIRSRRLRVALLGVSGASALLWLPEWVTWLWTWHQPPGALPPPPVLQAAAQVLMFSLSAISPLILLLMSDEFKEGLTGVWQRVTSPRAPEAAASPGVQEQGAQSSEVLPGSSTSSPDPEPGQQPDGFLQQSPSQQLFGSQDSKENPVLPDVEQFWHEREAQPPDNSNDPIPWEHQEHAAGTSDPSGISM